MGANWGSDFGDDVLDACLVRAMMGDVIDERSFSPGLDLNLDPTLELNIHDQIDISVRGNPNGTGT